MAPQFTKAEITSFLAQYGYTSDPSGLIQFFPVDYAHPREGTAYIDISAHAVRKGGEVPDRPIRIVFQEIQGKPFHRWELRSVTELDPGVKSRALDRQPGTPKKSPWPRPAAVG